MRNLTEELAGFPETEWGATVVNLHDSDQEEHSGQEERNEEPLHTSRDASELVLSRRRCKGRRGGGEEMQKRM